MCRRPQAPDFVPVVWETQRGRKRIKRNLTPFPNRVKPKVLALAKRLGVRAEAGYELPLSPDLVAFADEGLTGFRVVDIALPEHKIALELTLESVGNFMQVSLHKQGQLADYYLAGFRPFVITP